MHGGHNPRPLLSAPACHSAQGGLCLFTGGTPTAKPLSVGIGAFRRMSLLAAALLFAGCTAQVVIIPPPTQIAVSQGLAPLEQTGPELSKPKPKTRSIVVRQTVPSLGQKTTGTARQPGSFGDEFGPEYQ